MDEPITHDPEIDLMLQVRHGNREVFEQLACRYRPQLVRFFYPLCWNIDTAQDLAQEVLVKLWLVRERYQPSARLSTFVFKIARNHWLMEQRTRKCRPKPMSLEEVWEPVADAADLEKMLLSRYMDRRIREQISELPEHCRLVFVLSHFQGLKYSEIAEILEIPVGTVKSRMSAAVRMLREKLSEEMRDEA